MGEENTPSKTANDGSVPASPGYLHSKSALVNRMHRIEGQTRGIEKMISENQYCIDILNQIAAVRTALDRVAIHIVDEHINHALYQRLKVSVATVAIHIVDEHINHCVKEAIDSKDRESADVKRKELMEVIDRFMKIR